MKKNLIKGAVLALSLTLTMGLFAGCGGSGGDNGDAERTDLKVAIDADYDTLHPSDWSSVAEHHINGQIYDTLLRKNYEDQTQLEPRVAKEWKISDDGKCYTFYLRDDVTFHDGSKLTAADIAYTLDTYAASKYQGAVVEGFDHYEIVDDYTIEVYTKDVYAPFLASMDQMYIACKAYGESASKEDFAQKPIGCGPYKFVEHKDGDTLTLEAYDGYYMGEASIKTVTFKVISDIAALGMGVQSGDYDFAEIDASVLSSLEGSDKIKTATATQTTFAFIAMNTEKEPYNNVKFRQAINYAMDRESMVAAIQEGQGEANSNLLTPDRQGYSDKQTQYSYDPDKAKALLKEAGVAEGTDLGTMYVAEQYKTLAEMVESNLKAVGLTVKIEILEFNAYLEKLSQGDFGLTCLQMSLEGDTQQMSMAVCSDYIGMANNARYSNPEIDALFEKAAATIDDDDRTAVYEEIFTKIQDEAVYAVLYNPTMLYAHNANLKLHTLPIEGVYYFYDFSW